MIGMNKLSRRVADKFCDIWASLIIGIIEKIIKTNLYPKTFKEVYLCIILFDILGVVCLGLILLN